jgi:hypothetical protein
MSSKEVISANVDPSRIRVWWVFAALIIGGVHAFVFDLIANSIVRNYVYLSLLGQRIFWIPRLVIFSFFAFTMLFTFWPARPFYNKGMYVESRWGVFLLCYFCIGLLLLFSILSNEVVVAFLALSVAIFSNVSVLFYSPAGHFSVVSVFWVSAIAAIGGVLLLSPAKQVDDLAERITFTGRLAGSSFPVSFLSDSGTVFDNEWLVPIVMAVFYFGLLYFAMSENRYYFAEHDAKFYLDPNYRGLENLQRFWSRKLLLRDGLKDR